ncbi:MAG: pilus assembly PilX N-terminal domain-containing protein [Calditerrivibrio sp.]|nr:pilus assembly PilX N-terminal domain-containing protein [Calditerrivibrio sp.]
MYKRGSILIYAVFLLLVFSFIGVSLVNMLSGENISSVEELNSSKAFFLAESGIEIAMVKNLSDGNYNYNLDKGKIILSVRKITDDNESYPPSSIIYISSLGEYGGAKRKLETKYRNYY